MTSFKVLALMLVQMFGPDVSRVTSLSPAEDNPTGVRTKRLHKHLFQHLMDVVANVDMNEFSDTKFK